MNRLLITGAAGDLGRAMRERLGDLATEIRVADRKDVGPLSDGETPFVCDLADREAVFEMVRGCDGIIHFGGQPIEAPWSVIRDSNIEGMVNLYEAARANGHPRIVYASSNHAVGYYEQTNVIDSTAPTRPDSLYGVSKVFGEALASMYHDKFGQETAIIRIGSSLPAPLDHRMLSTWLSYRDFAELIRCVFRAPKLGCPIIFGVSENKPAFWDNSQSDFLGWKPQDSAEIFRAQMEKDQPNRDMSAADAIWVGGSFTADGIHDEPD